MTPPPPPLPPGWKCPRRVGFLFPHACLRTTPVGCPDCQNGMIEDPYALRTDRYGYSRYDYYADNYFLDLMPYYDPGVPAAPVDFTEADGADLVTPGDDFETDMSQS
ncbi:MAG TPA: hypothetical protein VKU19_33175 [Bryobacteraceae bacterium]|nr:hypothetical protein [Bryobacteraceae bacterium]